MGLVVVQDQTGAKRRVKVGLATRQATIAYLFLAPALIYFTIFFFYPIAIEVWTSLQSSTAFVGLANYVQAFQDQRTLESFKTTFIFAAGVTFLSIVLGLGMALLLDQPLKGRAFFRAALLVPYLTSIAIVGLMWRNILDPQIGVLNALLQTFHLPTQDWLINYHAALPMVIGIAVWQGVGYTMVFFLAGLQGIPEQYYEASRVDGAGAFTRFRFITLPLLAPTTLFVFIIGVIGTLKNFGLPYVITQGGPADSTRLYVYHVFSIAFTDNNIGYASALTFLLFLVILALTIIQMRLGRKATEY